MSDSPFGFGPPSSGDEPARKGGDQPDPFAALFGGNPQDLGAAFQRLGQMLSSTEQGPVNWQLARDVARQAVAAGGDASVGDGERAAVTEAMRLADLWLDPATALPAGTSRVEAWSRAEWVEHTLPTWRQLVDPVAERVGGAMGEVVPAEMQQMAGPLLGMMRQMGGAMFGAQVGQALAQLATEVVSSTDVGIPLTDRGRAALLPANVAKFGAGLEVPDSEVRLFLALREAAHQRLFGHVPWLPSRLTAAVTAYAAGIRVDTSRLEQAMSGIDPSNPEALQEALTSGMFEPETTPEQQAALTRLETLLALVEGWVDEVVAEGGQHLPSAAALRETVRRRRATGGPAEQTFASLVGLELRPRRLREAAALWRELREARGVDGRDAVWAHPDLLPTAEDLGDPAAFVHRVELDLSGLEGAPPPKDDDESGGGGAAGGR